MLWFILILLGVGLIFGAIARLLVPGRDDLSIAQTWLLGVVGSLLGGFLGYVLFGADIEDGAVQAGGVVSSIIGSVIVLLLYRLVRRRHRPARTGI